MRGSIHRLFIITFVLMGAGIILLSGCVSQNDYTELAKRNEQLAKGVESLQKEIKLLKDGSATAQELERLKEDNTRLREERDSLEKQVKILTEPKSKLFGVVVIAPSVSTSMEARLILSKQGWIETNLRNASAALVVVRSMLYNPLMFSYESFDELERDAEMQLNISGENFHVYIYSLDDRLKPTQLKHISYKAD